MKKQGLLQFAAIAAAAAALTGCIHNDIPYPRIQANFRSINAEGQVSAAVIDSINCTVSLTLGEDVDPYAVNIMDYTLTPGATVVDDVLNEPLDLSKPKYVTLKYYQEYTWVISATCDVERYFEVEGQMGATYIDVPSRRVIVDMPATAGLSSVRVVRAKLGPKGSTMTPNLSEGGLVSLVEPLDILVEEFGRASTWTVYVNRVEATVTTTGVDAWTCVAWVHGQGQSGKDNGVEYRLAGSEEWTKLAADKVTHDGGNFTGLIEHLDPETAYEARVYSDEEKGSTVQFTTGAIVQIPNSDFDSWWLDGKVWDPWPEGGEQVWDTGNKGATTLGASNTFPTDDTPTGTGLAAQLETRFVGIGVIGKLAAGNIFVGRYVRTDGTNGVLSFGRAFTERPTKLRGYLKYTNVPISHTNSEFTKLKGQPDTCIVWCSLIDSANPFEIRTNPANRNLFDPEGDYVVAYGRFQSGDAIPEYIPFEIELNYTSTSRVPRYILITASASKYGDYFTGGAGSVLYLDDLELLYDY